MITPYRMVIINEETFEERIQFKISKLSVLMLSLLSFSAIAGLVYASIAYTSLKEYIPGYDSTELRKQALNSVES